jgi:glycerol-3-phosphate dehydrogenase
MATLLAEYDVIVVGAGINGAGIARDAALRGLSVLLLDKNDIGSGTSSWSSRLIHGGLRYLEYGEIPLVFESLHERRRLRRIAPHLVKRLRLRIPVYEDGRRGMFLIRMGMIAYDLLSIGKSIPRHRMLNREAILEKEPGVNSTGLLGAASFFDAQVTFAERLVVENVIAASEAGAHIRTYSPLIGITVAKRRVQNIQFHDAVSGAECQVKGRMIINAAGPWVDRVLATVNREMKPLMGGTKGSHIVVGNFRSSPQDAFYVEAESDGRPFFIIPWNHQFLIGTTDKRFSGDPAEATASDDEIDYLLAETNRVFPQANLSRDDVHYAYAGVRPLPRRPKGPESAITRKHIIKKHGRVARGLVSIVGGKLTTYRNLSEQVVDFVVRILHADAANCTTGRAMLPGGESLEAARRRLHQIDCLSSQGRERLLSIYGGRSSQLLDLAQREPQLLRSLDAEGTVLAAEVIHAIREEFAVTLEDIVHRRMMVGFNADQGQALTGEISALAAAEFSWSRRETAAEVAALEDYNKRFTVRSN